MAQPAQQQSEENLKQGLADKQVSSLGAVWRRFKRNRLALLGLVILALLGLIAILAPYISPYDRDITNLKLIDKPPSAAHYLGTDYVGRDNFTRLLWGGRVSYTLALVCVTIYMVFGSLIGAMAGYFGGWIDSVLMRLVDIFVSFPFILLALTIVALWGPSITNLIIAFVFLSWPVPARLVRGQFLSLREQDFVEAAHAMGASSWRTMMKHMLPNAMAPLIVQATLDIAVIILSEAGLSFLGMGVRDPIPTWGNMLTVAQSVTVLKEHPEQWMPPGLMIFLSVVGINFVGDGLRDALDPRLKR